MSTPLIYILCTSQRLGRLAVEVDAHITPNHPVLRYVWDPNDLSGSERGSLCVDLLDCGEMRRDWKESIRAHVAAREMRQIELWRIKSVIRALEAGA